MTGANGFIGKKLVSELSKIKCQIKILTRKENLSSHKKIEVFIGDLIDPNISLLEFLKNCDILYHCAGEINDENKMSLLHVNGTQKLLDSISNNSGKKIHWIQLSSCGAYGPPNDNEIEVERLVNEKSKHNPSNKYEVTKTKSDELIMNSSSVDLIYTILRPSNVIGAEMKNKSIFKLIKWINSGFFFFIGKKDSVCTFIHVNDVVRAMMIIPFNQNSKNEIFNISYDCTWEDLIKKISNKLKIKVPSLRIPFRIIIIPYKVIKLIFGKIIHIPKIHAFAYRTRYSTNKIETLLDFKFSKVMPDSIEDLID